ncbi:DNA-3-methyladenine glycosylase [Neobacillus mesonae]|uniref:DNA-3-methyladenine glycosylase family protein n=1 Tax=Neobacillus mesonae TaxID=1193713 RepID=UPI00203A926B|nr:DNA-3-methyladenine glycosylase [Neobacillus mesonae]MCM3571212.1 DNA-3-methyladenine glycosylase [Neobacillus mesonae]
MERGKNRREANEDILIDLPHDFNMKPNLGYLERNKNECMFEVENEIITRVIGVGDLQALVQIYVNNDNQMVVHFVNNSTHVNQNDRAEISCYIQEWFDLNRDLTPFYELAKKDLLLKKPVQDFYGLRVIGVPDLFEALCWGVLGQQINLSFAYTLKRKFVEKFGDSIIWNGRNYWIFPSYEKIAQLTLEDLTDIKMTRRKSEFIIGIAQLMASGELSKEKLVTIESLKEAEKSLTKIRGIGPWTANYVLMRCLRFTSAFPIDDAGLHNAVKKLTGLDRKPTKEELLTYAAGWENWQAYATFYIWRVHY